MDSPHFTVRLLRDGDAPQAFAAPPDLPVLLAAERAGLRMESSCRNGTCRACLRQLTTGRVHYRIAWPGLSADEKQEGYLLPCVAYPLSDLELAPQ